MAVMSFAGGRGTRDGGEGGGVWGEFGIDSDSHVQRRGAGSHYVCRELKKIFDLLVFIIFLFF